MTSCLSALPLIDKCVKVFSGEVTPSSTTSLVGLKADVSGVAPPLSVSEADFDPAANITSPQIRLLHSFLARSFPIQFHRALSSGGDQRPLHRFPSIKQSCRERLNKMLSMGQEPPWPDEFGPARTAHMDATAIVDYFAPLKMAGRTEPEREAGRQGGLIPHAGRFHTNTNRVNDNPSLNAGPSAAF